MDKIKNYFPFWNKLTSQQQRKLSDNAVERTFKKGEKVHEGSSECTGVLLVTKGRLRVYTVTEEGKEITLYRLFERDMCLLSASCIINSLQFDVTVSAEEDSVIINVPADVYKGIMAENAAAANYTNEIMASRFSEVMWVLEQVLSKKLDTRVAALLLEESEFSENGIITLTHEQLANHIGSAREVVTRMLKYFQNEGIVKLSRGSIEITDRKRLSETAYPSMR